MDLYVVTPSGETVASRVHAAVLICVKTAAILGAILALGPLKEEDYMRLVKVSMERKDHLVGINGCEHSWHCFGKPAIIFHDRGKIFTSERARSVLVDRLGIITEQAPPYAPSAKGTVESLFRWMTERFEKRLPNSSYGIHDAETVAQAGGMTLEELERCFYRAIVDDYQREFDTLRQQRRYLLWEQAVAASGVPQYLDSPDDLSIERPRIMAIAYKTATDYRFRGAGMCAQDCSHDCGVVSLTCTTIDVISVCSTSSLKAPMWAKPIAHN